MTIVGLNGIPDSWTVSSLGEVCSTVTDGTHKTPNYVESGVRFISIKNIRPFSPVNWEVYKKFIEPEEHAELIRRCRPEYEDILFPRIGTLGFAKRIDFQEEISIFVGLGLAKPIREIIQPKYLEYWMNHPMINQLSHDRANGSGRLTLPLEESRKLPVVLAPYAEQSRIVAKLEELMSDLDAGVAELKAAQKKLQQFRQSLLKAAVEGALTTDWREAQRQQGAPTETGAQLLARILTERRARWEAKQLAKFKEQGKAPPKSWQESYSEPRGPETVDSPVLPEEWTYGSLDQLLLQLRSGSAETSQREQTGFPVLKSSAVRPGAIDFSALNYLTEAQSRPENYIEAGDLLVSRLSGSVEYVGCCAQVPEEGALQVQYPDRLFCGKLAADSSILGPHIVICMSAPHARARIEKAAKSTAGHKRISLSDLHPFPIPMPPLTELNVLVGLVQAGLDQIASQESAIKLTLQQSLAQRQNILRAAFAGQLVPQDSNDEPASVLLERIRTEQTEHASLPKPRKPKKYAEA